MHSKVKCPFEGCNVEMYCITNHVHKFHNVSTEEFRKLFPKAKLRGFDTEGVENMRKKKIGKKLVIPKKECLKCHRLIGATAFKRHVDSCSGVKRKKSYEKRRPWNKGLTKETDERVAKSVNTLLSGFQSGRIKPAFLGKKHTEKTKNKISGSRLKWLHNHPSFYENRFDPQEDSYPEKILEERLQKGDLGSWVKKYRCSIYTYDFANLEQKIDLEIDSRYHWSERRKNADSKRDAWSKNNGWRVIRVQAKDVINDLDSTIEKLKLELSCGTGAT